MGIIIKWLLSALVILVLAYVVPGITVSGFVAALIVALVLGLVNAFVKPILTILTLPITIITLGLFMFVINALMIMLVAAIVPDFHVAGFFPALLFSIIFSLAMSILKD